MASSEKLSSVQQGGRASVPTPVFSRGAPLEREPPVRALEPDLVERRREEARVERAKRRRREHGRSALLCRGAERSFLEVNSIQKGTAVQYDQHLKDLGDWLANGGIEQGALDELDSGSDRCAR